MTMNRDGIIQKIQALMSKTVDNGCSEEEALSALDKARAMMDAYEVTEGDLQLTREEKAVLRKEPPGSSDPHLVKAWLSQAVAEFCDCRVWRARETGGLVFCGLRSDAQFATFLVDSLSVFVLGELAKHLHGCMAVGHDRKRVINGFCAGATARIGERLRALVRQSAVVATSNGRALVVVKGAAVSTKMKELGIKLSSGRRSSRQMDGGAYSAGKAAGDRASFGRPVSGNGAALRIGR